MLAAHVESTLLRAHLESKLLPSLTSSDERIFEQATGTPLAALLEEVRQLPAKSLEALIFDTGKALTKHPLNRRGLAVFRSLLARRHVDRVRRERWGAHALHDAWMRHGLLTTRLRNFRPGASNFSLTAEEVELLGLASGLDAPLSSRPLAEERVWVTPAAQHVFRDSDAQYRMHIDQLMPTWKIFIFLEPVTLERGPFHYVRGSHAASLRKLRWLFERTNVSSDKRTECSPRHVARSQWCSSSPECLRRVFRAQQHDLKRHGFHATEPLTVDAGTLVLADTSGFHSRGLGPAGQRRTLMGAVQTLDRPQSSLSIFQIPRRPLLADGLEGRLRPNPQSLAHRCPQRGLYS